MATYTAHYFTYASASITAEVPEDIAVQGSEEISEWIFGNAPDSPTICAQCSGWGRKVSLELGDFEPVTRDEGPQKGLALVTDADGKDVGAV